VNWVVTASVSLKTGGDGDYHILPLSFEMDGNKSFAIDELVTSVIKEVARRGKSFDHIVFIKITQKNSLSSAPG
jgi:hypothetical protein